MTRLQDVALGGGLFVALVALVACAVQAGLEVLAVERDRRKDARGGRARAVEAPAAVNTAAPSPGLIVEDPSSLPDEVFAETVRSVHWDICDGWDQP